MNKGPVVGGSWCILGEKTLKARRQGEQCVEASAYRKLGGRMGQAEGGRGSTPILLPLLCYPNMHHSLRGKFALCCVLSCRIFV